MLSIGDFARLGQVSVRMLRHYDHIGLLTPAQTDPSSGYRYYAPSQLARLNRVMAMKQLGFGLDEVRRLLDDALAPDELRGMLRLRQAEVASEHDLALMRLAGVEHRLRLIEKEDQLSEIEYVVKSLPPRTLAARRASVATPADIGTVVEPLFGELAAAVQAAGGCPETGVAVYDLDPDRDDDALRMVVGYDYSGAPAPGFEVVALPAVEQCVCAVHLGSMNTIGDSWQQLILTLEPHGWAPAGPGREVYLRAWPQDDQSDWVTELQQPVRHR
ncbi:MerR family transcriptional regulator [uncultured Friedmanniella sp.]|uniref:MerR family transcriptional regulator n=1 Tax=uncultured Friedmanniella sp. TaxID=335381 RepID=UPI0035CA160D